MQEKVHEFPLEKMVKQKFYPKLKKYRSYLDIVCMMSCPLF